MILDSNNMLNLSPLSIFSLVLMATLLTLQIFSRRSFERFVRLAQILGVAAVFGFCIFLSYKLYVAWSAGSLARYFLPPHNPITYFLGYVGFRIFFEYIAAVFAALGLTLLFKKLDARFGGNFFERGEMSLAALGVILTGWPSLLLYIAVVLFAGVAGSCVLMLKARMKKQKDPDRFPLYFVWAPAAIAVILLRSWLIGSPFWIIGFARAF